MGTVVTGSEFYVNNTINLLPYPMSILTSYPNPLAELLSTIEAIRVL